MTMAQAMAEVRDLPFTVDEFRGRVKRVQQEIAKRGIDVLMINHLENIYYLSGFRTIGYYSFMALFVPASGEPVHLTRLIEKTTLQGTSWIPDRELYPDTENYMDACVRVFNARGWGDSRIGIDKAAWY